jgi:hypothetical protein
VADELVAVNPVFLGHWTEALRPVGGRLTGPLAAAFRDGGRAESERTLAASVLADYAGNDPEMMADLLMDSEPIFFHAFFHRVDQRRQLALRLTPKSGPSHLRVAMG